MFKIRYSLLIFLFILIAYNSNGQAYSDSYYKLQLDIGEYNSEIKEYLDLDYDYDFGLYNLALNLDLNKKYVFSSGLVINEPKWDYEDYLITLENNSDKLDVGITSSPAISEFLASDSLEGVYLKKGKYELWHGYARTSTGFRVDSRKQSGINIDFGDRELGYLKSDDSNESNQYFSYSDNYEWNHTDLDIETTLGMSNDDDLRGLATAVNIDSIGKLFNYYISLDYQSPQFQAVKSSIDYGHGKYDLQLRSYRSWGPYLMEGSLAYNQDNLDKEKTSTNKNLSSGVKMNYYSDYAGIYTVAVSYNRNNKYLVKNSYNTRRENEINLKLGYEDIHWEYNLDVNYNKRYNFITGNNVSEKEMNLALIYDSFDNLKFILRYNIERERDDDLERDFSLNIDYGYQLFENLDYDLDLTLDDEYSLRLNLEQGVEYGFAKNHDLELRLGLIKYLEYGDHISKKLIINYKYNF